MSSRDSSMPHRVTESAVPFSLGRGSEPAWSGSRNSSTPAAGGPGRQHDGRGPEPARQVDALAHALADSRSLVFDGILTHAGHAYHARGREAVADVGPGWEYYLDNLVASREGGTMPDFNDYSMEGRTYRYFKGKPLYGFGYGLSYTTFGYSNPTVSATSFKDVDGLTVSVDITNTGSRAGPEVVQLYVHDRESNLVRPPKELKGFAKVDLQPGDTVEVEIENIGTLRNPVVRAE